MIGGVPCTTKLNIIIIIIYTIDIPVCEVVYGLHQFGHSAGNRTYR